MIFMIDTDLDDFHDWYWFGWFSWLILIWMIFTVISCIRRRPVHLRIQILLQTSPRANLSRSCPSHNQSSIINIKLEITTITVGWLPWSDYEDINVQTTDDCLLLLSNFDDADGGDAGNGWWSLMSDHWWLMSTPSTVSACAPLAPSPVSREWPVLNAS